MWQSTTVVASLPPASGEGATSKASRAAGVERLRSPAAWLAWGLEGVAVGGQFHSSA